MKLGSFEPDFDDIKTFDEYKGLFPISFEVTEQELINIQKASIKDLKVLKDSQENDLGLFNADINGVPLNGGDIFNQSVTQVLTRLETYFLQETLSQDKYNPTKNATASDIQKYKNELRKLIHQYREIWQTYNGVNIGQLPSAMRRLKENIQVLEQQLTADIPVGLSELIARTNIDKTTGNVHQVSFLRSITGIANVILGAELEIKGTDFLNKHKPVKLKNNQYKAIQLGDIKILGSAGTYVDIREDIGLFDFDAISDELTVELANGNTIPLKQLLKDENRVMVLSAEGYQTLRNEMLMGISAKAGQSATFKLYSGLTINRIFQEFPSNSWNARIWALYHWNQLYMQNGEFTIDTKVLTSTYNLAMSHIIPFIVGAKNQIFLTRRGFESTYDYLTKVLNNQRRVRANGVKFKSGANVEVPNI